MIFFGYWQAFCNTKSLLIQVISPKSVFLSFLKRGIAQRRAIKVPRLRKKGEEFFSEAL